MLVYLLGVAFENEKGKYNIINKQGVSLRYFQNLR